MISSEEIRRSAGELGLELVSLLGVESLRRQLENERERLGNWQKNGYAGEMRYMERPPELFTTLEHFLPTVRSVAVFSLSYFHEPYEVPPCPPGHGRIARYAWGLDYHTVLRAKLEEFVCSLQRIAPFEYRVFSDCVPLLERSIAATGGLGFIGKNTLLIRPGVGSYTFLAEVLLSLEVEEQLETHRGSGCGSCFRCAANCPTGAIVSPHELNASKCISYLTIEKRTPLSEWEEQALGEWVFGCDLCQEVCPFNNSEVKESSVSEFNSRNGVGPFLNLKEVLGLRDPGAFKGRFKNTPILRAKREQLIRNACAVIGNRGDVQLTEALLEVIAYDPAQIARESAEGALRKLAPLLNGSERRRVINQVPTEKN